LLSKIFLSGLLSPHYESLQVPFDPSESLGINILTKSFVLQAHAKNIKVEPWTVDDPDLMKLYIEIGVDGIDTDRPDLMLKLLNP
jgi:glycerophosphoryl diester phosphodiesterase